MTDTETELEQAKQISLLVRERSNELYDLRLKLEKYKKTSATRIKGMKARIKYLETFLSEIGIPSEDDY